MKTMNIEKQSNQKHHTQTGLTHAFKKEVTAKVKRLYINKEFVAFVTLTISRLPVRDKLSALHYFKKLAVQVLREPDPSHYAAFKDEYDEELSSIQAEQKHFEPVRFFNSEIEYIINTSEKLTADDVNHRLDIMQNAKERLSKDLLTKVEVMDLFNISKSTLNRRIAEGMPCHKKGKPIYFDLKEISEWLKSEAA
jgi:predicted DNA-binding transcriptional regulator AlpA